MKNRLIIAWRILVAVGMTVIIALGCWIGFELYKIGGEKEEA